MGITWIVWYKQEDIQNSQYASHEPSIKKDGIIIPPEGFYLLSGAQIIYFLFFLVCPREDNTR